MRVRDQNNVECVNEGKYLLDNNLSYFANWNDNQMD